ncbi:MAG: neutral zinc metallopeptidase [Microthrixaceae bacterium]
MAHQDIPQQPFGPPTAPPVPPVAGPPTGPPSGPPLGPPTGPPLLPPPGPWASGPWVPPGPAPVPPVRRPHRPRRRTAAVVTGVAAFVVVALLAGVVAYGATGALLDRGTAAAGAAGSGTVLTSQPVQQPDGVDSIVIRGGDPSDATQQVVRTALADVDGYWRRTYPQVFGGTYRTVQGGFYAADGRTAVPCTQSPEQVRGNAFYCPEADVIAWDAVDLLPSIRKQFGDLGVALVLAHEWGHAVQSRARIRGPVVFLEQQADCMAGAWVADVRDAGDRSFAVDGPALDKALAGFLALRDQPGITASTEANAHGSAFDRIRAFQDGVDGGASACADYTVSKVANSLVALPFTSEEDYANQGNLPLQQAYESMSADLKDYWSTEGAPALGISGYAAPSSVTFASGKAPTCDRREGTADLFYCPGDTTIAVQTDGIAARAVDRIGDFALGALLGRTWAFSALDQAGDRSTGAARDRRADCLTGAWTASVFRGERQGAQLSLSPGDLDEAVGALLGTSRSSAGSKEATGFDRVAAYRSGFTDGPSACRA